MARGLGLAFTNCATNGHRAEDVARIQIPSFLARSAHPNARYELGCLYVGVNDVRALDWDPALFGSNFRRALTFLRQRADRVLTLTAPLDLGRPRAGPKVAELNYLIATIATETNVLLVRLDDFRARNHVMVDHVHPTALGQIAIAERALAVLQDDGMPVRVAPHTLIDYEVTAYRRLLGDATYAYRHAKVSFRAAAILSWLALARRLGRRP